MHTAQANTGPVLPAYRRYCVQPLPATAYLPSRHSHDGHAATPPNLNTVTHETPCEPKHWATCTPYLYAVDLYNAGYWFEAKSLWQEMAEKMGNTPDQYHFLTGLRHAADALLSRRMGWRSAVAQARGRCAHVLSQLATEPYMGLEVRLWRTQLDRCLRPGGMDFPRMELRNHNASIALE